MSEKLLSVPKKGLLFIFEGPDGVGKSTIVNEIAKRITAQGENAIILSFPGKTQGSLGHLIYELHHSLEDFNIKNISATSLQMLHVAAHIDCIEKQIAPTISQGTHVILDRYWWSTIVYGQASGVPYEILESMVQVEKNVLGELLPNIVFLLVRDEPFRKELSTEKWKYICSAYNKLSDQETQHYHVEKITNNGPIRKTIEKIMKFIATESSKYPSEHTAKNEKKVSHIQRDKWTPTKTTSVFDSYWHLAAERQDIFFKRLQQLPPLWTDDPILQTYKFTNAYRASDRVSQFLIKNVIYQGDNAPEEVFFRIILFKMFNKIDTWILLESELKEIRYDEYNFNHYDDILTNARKNKCSIYSGAYIMPSGGNCFGYKNKHQNNLKLLELMMKNELPKRVFNSQSMQEVFCLFLEYPMIGDFLAYQYTIDINYSNLTNFSEMSFVLPGPGAKDGIRKCFSDFGGLSEVDLIKLMTDKQEEEFKKRNIDFKTLWGRPLQLIDCQNIFCEVDKYSRMAHPEIKGLTGRTRIKQKYHMNPTPIEYFYPPKWKINDAIKQTMDKYKLR